MADEDIVQGQPEGGTDTGAVEPVPNRAPWADDLDSLPESVRPLVEPVFRKYDANTTQRFQKYSQDLEPYKAWDESIQQFGSPEIAQQAFSLMQAINDDPERVYKLLAENYGYGDQGVEEPDTDSEAEYVDPEFASVKQMTEAMAEIMLAQQQEQQYANEDAQLNAHLEDLKTKFGDYDEEYVLAHLQLGYTGEQAVAKYQQAINARLTSAPTAPTILGGGGGLPSQAMDPGNMSSKDIKNLMAQMLAQAAQTSQE